MSLRQKKVRKKKQEILRTAAEVLYEKGYHGTTMEEIASRLLMTQGSMYYYFKNKDDLLYQCHNDILENGLIKIKEIISSTSSPTQKLKEAIEVHINFAIMEKPLFSLLNRPDQIFSDEYLEGIIQMRSKYDQCFDIVLKEGIQKKEFSKIDIKMTRFIILGALNSIENWYSPNGEKNKEEIAHTFSNYLLKIVLNHTTS